MKKPDLETIKTIVISVLVTAIIAFIGGINYQSHQQTMVNDAVKNVAQNSPVSQVKK